MPAEPEPEPRGLPYSLVQDLLDAMPEQGQGVKGRMRDCASKTKARLTLMAYTGLPPRTIMRLRPRDVRWDAGAVFIQGRRKGKGTKGQTIPLTSAGLEALRRFDEVDCWGSFSTSSAWKSFQGTCARPDLTGLRPYDLRHSFGTAVYAATGDLRATQQLLGHASRATTDRYTLAAVPGRLKVLVGQVEKLQRRKNVATTDRYTLAAVPGRLKVLVGQVEKLQRRKNVAVHCGSTKPILVRSRKQSTRP